MKSWLKTLALFSATLLSNVAWAQGMPPRPGGQPPRPPNQPGPTPARAPGTGSPQVVRSIDQAVSDGSSKNQAIIIAVGQNIGNQLPQSFSSTELSNASRSSVILAAVNFDEKHDLFKGNKIKKESVPAILIFDQYGNLSEPKPMTADAATLLAAAQTAQDKCKKAQADISRFVDQGKAALKKKDEKAAIKAFHDALSRHFRGFKGLDEALSEIRTLGEDRIKKALEKELDAAIKELEAIIKEFEGTVVEAMAELEKAKLLKDKKNDKAGAKRLLKKIVDEMPWPDYKGVVDTAKPILDEVEKG